MGDQELEGYTGIYKAFRLNMGYEAQEEIKCPWGSASTRHKLLGHIGPSSHMVCYKNDVIVSAAAQLGHTDHGLCVSLPTS